MIQCTRIYCQWVWNYLWIHFKVQYSQMKQVRPILQSSGRVLVQHLCAHSSALPAPSRGWLQSHLKKPPSHRLLCNRTKTVWETMRCSGDKLRKCANRSPRQIFICQLSTQCHKSVPFTSGNAGWEHHLLSDSYRHGDWNVLLAFHNKDELD